MTAEIRELQGQGYDIPDYPSDPSTDEERETQSRYATVLGSAVNPVLREGNSDRRAPQSVKNFAKKHPHRLGPWTAENRARVVSMSEGDFYVHEQSVVMTAVAWAGIVTLVVLVVAITAGILLGPGPQPDREPVRHPGQHDHPL